MWPDDEKPREASLHGFSYVELFHSTITCMQTLICDNEHMNERFNEFPQKSGQGEQIIPTEKFLKDYGADTEIDLNNKLEVLGEAADIELDVLGGNIDGLSDDEVNKKVALAEKLLPALARFGEKSMDASEQSIIEAQITTLTDFVGIHKKPSLQ